MNCYKIIYLEYCNFATTVSLKYAHVCFDGVIYDRSDRGDCR